MCNVLLMPSGAQAQPPAELNRGGTHWTLVGPTGGEAGPEDVPPEDSGVAAEEDPVLDTAQLADQMRPMAIFYDYPEHLYVADADPVTAAWLINNPDAQGGSSEYIGEVGGSYGSEIDELLAWNGLPWGGPGPMFASLQVDSILRDILPGVVVPVGDQRWPVIANTGLPNRHIVKINSWAGPCTATLIGPHTLLTAAHCMYNKNKQHSLMNWSPGASSQAAFPNPYQPGQAFPAVGGVQAGFVVDPACPMHGSGQRRCYCYSQFFPKGWKDDPDGLPTRWDFGALEIIDPPPYAVCPDSDPGAKLGWMQLHTATDDQLEDYGGVIVGYPDDKPNQPTAYASKTPDVWSGSEVRVMNHHDTFNGMSGSAYYHWRPYHGGPVRRLIYGVHQGGTRYGLFQDQKANQGPRVRPTMLKFLSERTSVSVHWD